MNDQSIASDHYIACVLIIFAALLVTIPTYREMRKAQTMSGNEPMMEIVAGTSVDHSGFVPDPMTIERGPLPRLIVQPAREPSSHASSGVAMLAIEPGTLNWTVIEGPADVARTAAVDTLHAGTTSDEIRNPGASAFTE